MQVTPSGVPCLSINSKETAAQVLDFIIEAEKEEADPDLKKMTYVLKRQLRYQATGTVEP